MNAQPNDLLSVLGRIEHLERQNRRLKQIAVGVFMLLVAACALSAGGQQQPSVHNTQKTPAQPDSWRLSDGRLVVFPGSVKVEQVDAAALDLPPGTKVIGWESVDGANFLLPGFDERVATIPTTKGKLDALANAAGILQTQIALMKADIADAKSDIAYAHSRIGTEEKSSDRLAKILDGNTGMLAYQSDDLKRKADELKRELDDFKDAACPVLRSLRESGTKLDYACRLH